MLEFIDKTSTQGGTPINRANLMAMQGFVDSTTVFNQFGVIETNSKGEILVTSFRADGSILEEFIGEKTINKSTVFNEDGSITVTITEGGE